jgi:predicted PolB exonuclease-like 3'-5' exonuclease
MDGSKVWDAWQTGEIAGIRDYCETDVMNTYLVSLRFRLMRGELSRPEYDEEILFVRGELKKLDKPHWHEFLAAWPE